MCFARLAPCLLLCALADAAPPERVTPQEISDAGIAGFHFPESEATLTRWITGLNRGDDETATQAFAALHAHGWGLWTALTAETGQRAAGQRLRVFETWQTLDEVADGIAPTTVSATHAASVGAARPLRPLRIREQEARPDQSDLELGRSAADRVLGFVKFDPTAAAHIARQQLLRRETLDALLEAGAIQVPPFPATTLAIKPVFQIARIADLVDGRYFRLKAWSGPPDLPRAWAPTQWNGAVWVDLGGTGEGRGEIDSIALPDGSTRRDATTYPLADFIHYRLSAADVALLNEGKAAPVADAGDVALLVAMHVAGREIARWTWQTFWWTAAADDPPAPSSAAIAAMRPAQLAGPARHYAMALAYTMLSPDQPYAGGRNTAPAVYAYNPWLEARLGPADLPDSVPGFAPDGRPAANNVGVATNCMSCHAQANYHPHELAAAPRLAGARYVDLRAAEFTGTLQVDFLWSLARHAR